MDATTWNAYQIVSNRARAVCYATRQNQFRMKTEYTVNKLVHTTEQQLSALDHMSVSRSYEKVVHVFFFKGNLYIQIIKRDGLPYRRSALDHMSVSRPCR